jgi:hypothetical protein
MMNLKLEWDSASIPNDLARQQRRRDLELLVKYFAEKQRQTKTGSVSYCILDAVLADLDSLLGDKKE